MKTHTVSPLNPSPSADTVRKSGSSPIVARFETGRTSSGFGTYTLAHLTCGHCASGTGLSIGDAVDCHECAANAVSLQWLTDLDASTVHHARYKVWCGVAQYLFYRRDAGSPSGFMLIRGVDVTPAIDALCRTKGISPLSPTEAA